MRGKAGSDFGLLVLALALSETGPARPPTPWPKVKRIQFPISCVSRVLPFAVFLTRALLGPLEALGATTSH